MVEITESRRRIIALRSMSEIVPAFRKPSSWFGFLAPPGLPAPIVMRLNVEKGTASKAEVKGYYVGGKTGTAEKVVAGRYSKTRLLNSFTAVMPADNPRYLLLIMLDEPQPLPETHGFATSGWNAVPVGGQVISRVAPILGIEPRFDLAPSDKLILASAKDGR